MVAQWTAATLVMVAGLVGVALLAGLPAASLVDLVLHHRYVRDLAGLAASACTWLLLYVGFRRGYVRGLNT